MLVTYTHRIDLFPAKKIYTIYPVAPVKFFIAQILFYTPPKPIEIMIFMQKSLLEIMI